MSEMSETFPMDFVGATRSDGESAIIFISSDEDDGMEVASTCSVDDLYLTSGDETKEVQLTARCIERQLAEPIPIPSPGAAPAQTRAVTPRPNLPPSPTLGERFFNLALGNGPVGCDDRVKANPPISLCRNQVPQVDTPLSPQLRIQGPFMCPIHQTALLHLS